MLKENLIKKLDSIESTFARDLRKYWIEWFKIKKWDSTIRLSDWDLNFDIWFYWNDDYYLRRIQIWSESFFCKKNIDLSFLKEKIDLVSNEVYRRIKLNQLWNDLFFSFDWVDWVVKFSWYDDSDWRDKYKPLEISDWDIKRSIDYKSMEAKYLWRNTA